MDLNSKLSEYDALPRPRRRRRRTSSGKVHDPLAMFSGDVMTVNVNLAGLPRAVVALGVGVGKRRDAWWVCRWWAARSARLSSWMWRTRSRSPRSTP